MRIADVLGRRSTPAPQAARVGRNRWRELESAPPEGWAPQLTHTVIVLSPSELARAQAAIDGSNADVLVLTEEDRTPDAALLARLVWWQHQCSYAVSVATVDPDHEDWLARYQRDTDYLDRAGFEAWRGAAAWVLAVPRRLLTAAGGISTDAGTGWQLELAYRLAQRGAVFVADAEATIARSSASDVAAPLQQVIPLLPERRPDWRQTHAIPTIHVVVDCTTAPEAADATVDGVLVSEYRDIAVSVVGAPSSATRSTDPRVSYVDVVPVTSAPVPFRLEIPAGCVLQVFSIRRMLNRMRESQLGLYQALVEPQADGASRTFAIRLLRTAAIERSRLVLGDGDLDDIIDELFGSTWVDARRFGIRHHADDLDASASPEDEDDDVSEDDESDEDDDS